MELSNRKEINRDGKGGCKVRIYVADASLSMLIDTPDKLLDLAVRPIHPRLVAPDVQPHREAEPNQPDHSRVHGVGPLRVNAR